MSFENSKDIITYEDTVSCSILVWKIDICWIATDNFTFMVAFIQIKNQDSLRKKKKITIILCADNWKDATILSNIIYQNLLYSSILQEGCYDKGGAFLQHPAAIIGVSHSVKNMKFTLTLKIS